MICSDECEKGYNSVQQILTTHGLSYTPDELLGSTVGVLKSAEKWINLQHKGESHMKKMKDFNTVAKKKMYEFYYHSVYKDILKRAEPS